MEKKLVVSSSHLFEAGDKVLVARGTSLGGMKWLTFVSKFYGPCWVLKVRHPRYVLELQHGRVSKRRSHARRLVLYRERKFKA